MSGSIKRIKSYLKNSWENILFLVILIIITIQLAAILERMEDFESELEKSVEYSKKEYFDLPLTNREKAQKKETKIRKKGAYSLKT